MKIKELVICLVIALLLTSWLWLPFLIFTSAVWLPALLVSIVLFRVFGFGYYLGLAANHFLDFLCYTLTVTRESTWMKVYEVLGYYAPVQDVGMMNSGFLKDGHIREASTVQVEGEMYAMNLYEYVGTAMHKFPHLRGMNLVDLGCGKGGGLHHLVQRLSPISALGVDFCQSNIDSCMLNYDQENLRFICGDITTAPIRQNSTDIALAVETFHCLHSYHPALTQASHFLKPGGHLVVADYFFTPSLVGFEGACKLAGFKVLCKDDISHNVMAALSADTDRRRMIVESSFPSVLRSSAWHVVGGEHSSVHSILSHKEALYLVYHLVKQGSNSN